MIGDYLWKDCGFQNYSKVYSTRIWRERKCSWCTRREWGSVSNWQKCDFLFLLHSRYGFINCLFHYHANCLYKITGSITTITFISTNTDTDGDIIFEYDVPDWLNASAFTVDLPFPQVNLFLNLQHSCPLYYDLQEGWQNVSVVASNVLQTTDPYPISFEMVGQIKGLTLDDNRIITTKEEVKQIILYSWIVI